MDFLAILAVVNCFISPVLFSVLVWLAYTYFQYRSTSHQDKVKLENRIALITRTSLNAVREAWFEEIRKENYANELEVEVKFVYPLIRYLGYSPSDLRIRVPMLIRAGRNDVQGTADSVLYRDSQPVIVIEVKAPGVPLNENAKLQARSYCLALKVSTYILINGKSIFIYRRGLDSDEKIFESSVEQLPSKWSELYELIGVQA